MSEIFIKLLNMSISAGYLVLAVLVLRLVMRKAPKRITLMFWCAVAVRLVCPFSLQSIFSLIPSAQTVSPNIMLDRTPEIDTGIPIINSVINPVITGSFAPEPWASANPLQILIPVCSFIWLMVIAVMLIYALVSYILLKRKVMTAVRYKDNIYQSENARCPFVLGCIRPKIYVPFNMNDKDIAYVAAHEQAHISRGDCIWKPLGFLLLCLHWFNPLVWVAYVILCRDIELACDEKVIEKLDPEARADYSETLLACSINRRMISACPLAFGEVGVKDRVKSVLSYKKPAVWVVAVSVAVCLAAVACFLTDPVNAGAYGIKSISAENISADGAELKIKYSRAEGAYSVRTVAEDEGEYCGDGIKDYDGLLGKYRILIEFGDAEPSSVLAERYPAGEMVELANSGMILRLKRVHPSDSGFVLYIGSDTPIIADTVEDAELSPFGGTVKIKIKTGIGG